jgi:hypothetical protein
MSQKRLDTMPAQLRALLRLLPLGVTLLMLAITLALVVELDMPRGTIAWLNRVGLSTPAMIGYTLAVAVFAFATRRDLVARNLRGLLTFSFSTSPYLFYCAFASYYLLAVDRIGSRVALVVFWGGYGFCAASMALVTLILVWARELELRDDA